MHLCGMWISCGCVESHIKCEKQIKNFPNFINVNVNHVYDDLRIKCEFICNDEGNQSVDHQEILCPCIKIAMLLPF